MQKHPNLKAPFFCICLSLCRFWSLGCFSKTCTGSNKCKKCKTRLQCQRSGLDWSGFLHFLNPVQDLELPGLDFLHFFEPVQVLEPWTLKTCTGSKIPEKQILYLFLKNGRQIAELFHRSIVLQNFPEVSISVSGLLLQSLQHIACVKRKGAGMSAKRPSLAALLT